MSKKKLTDWFDAGVKPAHVGAYETRCHKDDGVKGFQYWDGKQWGFWGYDPVDAYRCRVPPSQWQNPQWRGLAEKP